MIERISGGVTCVKGQSRLYQSLIVGVSEMTGGMRIIGVSVSVFSVASES